MNNATKQEIKEEIIKKLKKDLTEVLQKYEIKQQLANRITSDITILTILSLDKHLSLE